MSKQELIEKIKKLLSLSTDTSTTNHERDVALNRAKDLMAQYSIEEYDLKNFSKEELIVTEFYQHKLNNPLPSYFANPMLMNTIMQPICNNFGCYCCFHTQTGVHQIMGFKANVEISIYACDVLLNQGIKDFREGYANARSIGYGISFWTGFIEGLTLRFTKFSDETALVLYDKVKAKFEESIQKVIINVPTSSEFYGHKAGLKSATEATLNPGVSSQKGNLLK
jgi:hypothetical protein